MLTCNICTALDNIEGNVERQAQLQAESSAMFGRTTEAAEGSDYHDLPVQTQARV